MPLTEHKISEPKDLESKGCISTDTNRHTYTFSLLATPNIPSIVQSNYSINYYIGLVGG